ncbi:hypothetical protein NXC12_CH02215 [Rhizobium etli]|uniref:Uncharacterized protein n=1 Tax=Rhizobium etli TaxID=29449 RepID=A0AAN1BFY5_RHIET|nr:hypothetical protein NXC12_CH02215 [Rhizobium etli]
MLYSKTEEERMLSKSLIMPFSFAILALSGLLFQFVAYLLETPVTVLHP